MTSFRNDISYAAWLGAIIERLDNGIMPLPLEDHTAIERDRERFVSRAPCEPTAHDFTWRESACDPALAHLFERIHAASKEKAWEDELWGALLGCASLPPPVHIVRDLLSRDIQVTLIGHLCLPDALLWELADKVDESLLTLGKRRYINSEFTADQFEEVLCAFPTHHWLLRSLCGEEPSDQEKARRLIDYVSRHPDREGLIKFQSPTFARLWTLQRE